MSKDWSSKKVMGMLKAEGFVLAKMSREHGLASGTLANTLYRPWPKGQEIIAAALGRAPQEIWPSRY